MPSTTGREPPRSRLNAAAAAILLDTSNTLDVVRDDALGIARPVVNCISVIVSLSCAERVAPLPEHVPAHSLRLEGQ